MEHGDYPPEMQRLVDRIAPDWPPILEVDPGWYPLLSRLDARLSAIAPGYVLQQCKSKFGSLSFYACPSDDPSDYNEEFNKTIRARRVGEHRNLRGVRRPGSSVCDQPLGFSAMPQASPRHDPSSRRLRAIALEQHLAQRRTDPLVSDISGKIRFNLLRGVRMPEPWLSADDIADYLGVTKDTIYAWIADKGMPAHKVGRLWKFQASEVDDWVRRGDAASAE